MHLRSVTKNYTYRRAVGIQRNSCIHDVLCVLLLVVLCVLLSSYVYLLHYMCIAVFTSDSGLLA